ncbi:MAG: hypothetical protein M3004_05235, partial [Bacteroidota bacterium]|nr:hypothetical protein [Bacteroidota bacterium]
QHRLAKTGVLRSKYLLVPAEPPNGDSAQIIIDAESLAEDSATKQKTRLRRNFRRKKRKKIIFIL